MNKTNFDLLAEKRAEAEAQRGVMNRLGKEIHDLEQSVHREIAEMVLDGDILHDMKWALEVNEGNGVQYTIMLRSKSLSQRAKDFKRSMGKRGIYIGNGIKLTQLNATDGTGWSFSTGYRNDILLTHKYEHGVTDLRQVFNDLRYAGVEHVDTQAVVSSHTIRQRRMDKYDAIITNVKETFIS